MNSEKQNKVLEKSTGKKQKKNSIEYIFGGKMLTEDFIIKQSGLLFTIFFLILLFITNRYYCAKQLTEMDKLKKELVNLQDEQVELINDLSPIKEQMYIEELLKKEGIDLNKNNTDTIYQIKK